MHVYFLAIGGAGIGPLAQLAYQAGYEVSGSDMQNSSYLEYLKAHGIKDITISHLPAVINEAHKNHPIDWLVYSSAVGMDNMGQKQLSAAKALGIKTTKRDQFIDQFVKEHHLKMVAVAGTHGKTTTTAMLSWLFLRLNQPVSYIIPAKVSFGEMASFAPDSQYFIYEADEFDRNFLNFHPYLSLISGVSWDHHEIYPTRQDYIEAFRQFAVQSDKQIIWQTDASYLGLAADNLVALEDNEPRLKDLTISGLYNRRDAWLAIASINHLLGSSIEELIGYINLFPGLSRRMEQIIPGLYSDYAHTPDKIRGAMSVAGEIARAQNKELIVLYEPLTNLRQTYMLNEYTDCFRGAAKVYWLPSYLAREDPSQRIITPAELISHLADPSIAEPAELGNTLLAAIKEHLNKGHMVVAMTGGGGGSLDDFLRERFVS